LRELIDCFSRAEVAAFGCVQLNNQYSPDFDPTFKDGILQSFFDYDGSNTTAYVSVVID
jgi:hypothetical protein